MTKMTDRDALRSLLLYAHHEAKAQGRAEVTRLLALTLDAMAVERPEEIASAIGRPPCHCGALLRSYEDKVIH